MTSEADEHFASSGGDLPLGANREQRERARTAADAKAILVAKIVELHVKASAPHFLFVRAILVGHPNTYRVNVFADDASRVDIMDVHRHKIVASYYVETNGEGDGVVRSEPPLPAMAAVASAAQRTD